MISGTIKKKKSKRGWSDKMLTFDRLIIKISNIAMFLLENQVYL